MELKNTELEKKIMENVIEICFQTPDKLLIFPEKLLIFIHDYVLRRKNLDALNTYLKMLQEKRRKRDKFETILFYFVLAFMVGTEVMGFLFHINAEMMVFRIISAIIGITVVIITLSNHAKSIKELSLALKKKNEYLEELVEFIIENADEVKDILKKDGIHVRYFSIWDSTNDVSYETDREFLTENKMKDIIEQEKLLETLFLAKTNCFMENKEIGFEFVEEVNQADTERKLTFLDEFLLKICGLYCYRKNKKNYENELR